jgi:hypothetical protein
MDWRHAAAAVLHGWAAHQHHAGSPIQLTEADYDAALAAVTVAPLVPHNAALSPYAAKAGG